MVLDMARCFLLWRLRRSTVPAVCELLSGPRQTELDRPSPRRWRTCAACAPPRSEPGRRESTGVRSDAEACARSSSRQRSGMGWDLVDAPQIAPRPGRRQRGTCLDGLGDLRYHQHVRAVAAQVEVLAGVL